MNIDKNDTAVVFIDPQNEVLSDKGLAWKSVGESVRENKTVENTLYGATCLGVPIS